jgi:gliding motility-associated-like protein
MRKLLLIISCFLYLAGVQAQIPSYVPKNGLVGWWPFNGNTNDSSGNQHHGTINSGNNGNITFSADRTGKSNSSVSFKSNPNWNQLGPYISIKNNKNLYFDRSYTINMWIKVSSNCEVGELLGKGPDNTSFFSRIQRPNGVGFGGGGAGGIGYNYKVDTTKWVMLTFTRNNNNDSGNLFIDGKFITTGTVKKPIVNSYDLTIGAMASGGTNGSYYPYQGKIDDIAIWNRALDPCEIASLYQAKVVSPKPSSVSIGSNTQKYCGLDSVNLTATTGFKTYVWNTGKTGNSLYAKNTGVYSVAATDSQGCTVYDTAVVSIMNPKITPRDTVVCYPNIVSLSATSQAGALACNKPSGTLANGLVGWWPFCGNANDISGNGNHTSVYGPVLTKDRFGMQNGAYLFDGVNDYLEGKFNNFPLGASARSISGWVKFNSKTPKFLNFLASWGLGTPFSSTSFGTAFGFYVHENMQSLYLWPSWTSTPFSNLKYNNNFDTINFYHLAVTYEVSGRFKFYINSKLVYTNTVADVNTVANNNIFRLGRSSHTNTDGWAGYLNGVLDDVGIWNRALTDNEILTLYGNDLKYTWSTADTVQKTTINLSGKSTVWVKTDNGIGTCYDTTTVTIQKPSVSLGVGDTLRLCGTDSVQLNATTGYKNYAWSTGKTGASAYVNKTGLISVSATDSLGCIAADTALVSIQNPRIFPRDTVVCSGNPVDLRTSNIVTWSTGDVAASTRIQTTGTTKVWVRSDNGIGSCYDTTTVGISNPSVNFAPDTLRFTNCNRDSLKVSVGKGWKSVAWSNSKTDTAINLKTTGKYSVKVQDNVGCFAYDTTYFINPGKVKVTVVAIDSVKCFNGSDGSITASTSGGFAPVIVAWNDPAKQNTIKATGLKAGNYKVKVSDKYGCADSATATVLQPAKLTVTLSRMDSIRCYRFTDGSITVTATGGTLPLNYRWNTGAQTLKIDNLGAGIYKVVVSDAYGCRDSFSANLNDPPELIARIVAGNRAMKGEMLNVSGNATPNGNHTYSWQPASLFGAMAGSQNASIKLEKNVTLKLKVTNKNGCVAKDSLDVEVIQPLKDIMPNAFSPNKDGLNEGFGIPDIFEVKEFYVYDRWGGIIFKGNASNPRWNGYVGNEPAPAGSYSYQITATLKGSTQDVSFIGKVALIK